MAVNNTFEIMDLLRKVADSDGANTECESSEQKTASLADS